MPAGSVCLASRLPNEFGSRQRPAVVEEPLIALQVCAARSPTSKLMLTILGGVATWEREIMLEWHREGIAKAKAEGKYKGRKPTVAVQAERIRAMRAAGEKPAHIARRLGVARSGVHRMLEGALGTSGVLSATAATGAVG
jgi:DNA invertase Pin-like site-specific DNA recombinase